MKKTIALLSLMICTTCFGQRFSVVVLPDIQNYTDLHPQILQTQIDWINANRLKSAIQCVIGVGDIVNFGVNDTAQWQLASAIIGSLNPQIPLIMAVGNHDMGTTARPTANTRNTDQFNSWFPAFRFSSMPYYAGHGAGGNQNSFIKFSVSGHKFLVLSLEFAPTDDDLAWANGIVFLNPSYHVIVVTHSYLNKFGQHHLRGDVGGLNHYGVAADGNDGQQVWDKFVKLHANIFMVLSGHDHSPDLELCGSRSAPVGINGNVVHEIFANFQGYDSFATGGGGYMRIMVFDFATKSITVSTYSPWFDEVLDMPNHSFTVPIPFSVTTRPSSPRVTHVGRQPVMP